MLDLLLVNFLTLVTEFAAIALASRQLGVSPAVTVPLAAIGLILMVGTGSYRRWEKAYRSMDSGLAKFPAFHALVVIPLVISIARLR